MALCANDTLTIRLELFVAVAVFALVAKLSNWNLIARALIAVVVINGIIGFSRSNFDNNTNNHLHGDYFKRLYTLPAAIECVFGFLGCTAYKREVDKETEYPQYKSDDDSRA